MVALYTVHKTKYILGQQEAAAVEEGRNVSLFSDLI